MLVGEIWPVVNDDVGQIHVSSHGMDKVVATNTIAVSVSTGGDDLEFVVSHLGTCGHGQGAAVESVHSIRVDITWQVRRTANATHGHYFMGLKP